MIELQQHNNKEDKSRLPPFVSRFFSSFSQIELDPVLLSGLAIAIVVRQLLHYLVFSFYTDDAYIFMRYANNFVDGHGLVYNINEPVLGFTSTTFVLILSGLDLLRDFVSLENSINIINTVFFACTVLAIDSLGIWSKTWRLCIIALWCFYLPWVDASVNGMETMLFIFLQSLAIWAFFKKYHNLAISLLALGALTRPEGALFLVAAALAFWRSRPGKFPWVGAVAGAILAGTWIVIATNYYGSPIPQSMLAKSTLMTKQHVWGSETTAFDKLILLSYGISSDQYHGFPLWVWVVLKIVFVSALSIFFIGFIKLFRDRSHALAIPLYFVLTWLFYVIGKPVRIWSWYTIPTSIFFILTCLYGAQALFESRRALKRLQVPLIGIVTLALIVSLPYGANKRKQSLMGMTNELVVLSNWILENCSNAGSVMIGDIGQVGYRLPKARIIDLGGLVSPRKVFVSQDGMHYTVDQIVTNERPDVACLLGDGVPKVAGIPGYRQVPSIVPRYSVYVYDTCRPRP